MVDLNNRLYYPMIVSNTGTAEPLSREEDSLVWKKFLSLSRLKQDIITDDQMPKKIAQMQQKFRLSELVVGATSLLIRKIFFEELVLSDVEASLKSTLSSGGDDQAQAKGILEYIQKEILTIKPKPRVEEDEIMEEKPVAMRVRMPLLQALSKYENLGNQLITEERIRIKSQSEPVRPSLLYWVKYYRDELGIGHHDSVQRGNFLFRSENGKRLSAEERERVNLVLKSVEENFPLEIDTERQEILFPVFVSAPAPRAVPPVSRPVPPVDDRETRESSPRESVAEKFQPRANPAFSFGQGGMVNSMATPGAQPVSVPEVRGGELSFSSKHVFPAEKRSEAVEATPAPAVPQAPVPQANPFRIRPVSLGKDES
ncbi:MAG: hypothetical protein WA082_03195 [Candidatus Moraniibacteriota bacterium]